MACAAKLTTHHSAILDDVVGCPARLFGMFELTMPEYPQDSADLDFASRWTLRQLLYAQEIGGSEGLSVFSTRPLPGAGVL